jgi:hypothetical protein
MFIKRGAQYSVYAVFGDRVLKVPNTQRQAIGRWKSWAGASDDTSSGHQKAFAVVQDGKKAASAMKLLSRARPEVRAYLAEPIFFGGGVYSQKKVEWLNVVFGRQTHEQNVLLLEQYASMLLFEWRNGFADSVFNFTINMGLMADGKLALIDFGEITFEKKEVEKLITSKVWLESWSYRVDMPKGLRSAYRSIMERTLTLDNLNRHWRTLV